MKTDSTFMDTSIENGVRERNKANKQGEAPNCMKK